MIMNNELRNTIVLAVFGDALKESRDPRKTFDNLQDDNTSQG